MRQAHFARPRHARSPAEQPRIRHRVMGRSKRPHAQESHALGQRPRYAVDLRRLNRLLKSKGRQYSREALRQHRLP